jgi:hypothetical protein
MEVSMKNIIDDDGDILNEPYYDDIDDFGNPQKDDRKWRNPDTDMSRKALGVCGREYFKSKKERSQWKKIEKAAVSLDMGIESVYPLEWIENIFAWASKKNKIQTVITFPALLSGIENKANKVDFIAKWKQTHVVKEISINTNDIVKEDFDW